MANTQDLAARIGRLLAVRVRPVTAALDARAAALAQRADALEARTTVLERLSFRSATVTLPQLDPGNTEVNVAWSPPFIDNDYGVTLTVEAGLVAVSRISVGVKAGTRFGIGCVAVVNNSAAVAIPAGVLLHALAWRVVGQGVH